jgi:hypothetical protein
MQLDQAVRRATHGITSALGWIGRMLKLDFRVHGLKGIFRIAILAVVLIALYYVVGSILMSKVDANLNFRLTADQIHPGESRAVAIAAALIDREVDKNGWVPDDPIYKPTILLDNMPNFQKGMLQSLGRFGIELTDQLGRSRGSSEADPDLEQASGLLRYPPDRWLWNPGQSWWQFTQTSEAAYRQASKRLKAYNTRLGKGQAIYEKRADNLRSTLDRIAADLGSSSATIDEFVEDRSGFPWDNKVDDLFYRTKGQLYAYYLLLRELEVDFAPIINERSLKPEWDQMLKSLAEAVKLQPMVILNPRPDAEFFQNHVIAQGFYLLRARTQLREITQILQT